MIENGLVSVVTATYNMADYIGETIDSILMQDYSNIESIVVDDGSTDNTLDVLKPYLEDPRVRLVQQANAGQTVAKNRGIAEARGEYIAFCDADDTWRKDKITKQLPCFEDPQVGVCFSDIVFVDDKGKILEIPPMERSGGRITAQLMLDNFVPFPTSMVRSDIIRNANCFDQGLSMSIDYDLWLRLSVDYKFAYVQEPLANYRIWDGQMSNKMGERLDNFFKILDRFVKNNADFVAQKDVDAAWAHVYVTRGKWHSQEGRKREAIIDFGQAMIFKPRDLRLWKQIAKLLVDKS